MFDNVGPSSTTLDHLRQPWTIFDQVRPRPTPCLWTMLDHFLPCWTRSGRAHHFHLKFRQELPIRHTPPPGPHRSTRSIGSASSSRSYSSAHPFAPSFPRLSVMPLQLRNLRDAYFALTNHVNVALRTQVGDPTWLREVRAQALALHAAGDRVSSSPC